MSADSSIILIESAETLQEYCIQLEHQSLIAVDTEFTRVRTYFSILELIQIAAEGVEFCVDAAQCKDLSALQCLVQLPARTFIFHSASQDLDVLKRANLTPARIFDTQIAAVLCGYKRISYQAMVDQVLGVSLAKELTRSKWDKRPFSQQQIEYAMDDVRYLIPLYNVLMEMLEQRNRLKWIEEECARLLKQIVELNHSDVWKHFHVAGNLPIPKQHIAKKLLIWRDQRARKRNLPLQWVLSNQQVMEIATVYPRSREQLLEILGIDSATKARWVTELQEILASRNRNSSEAVWKPIHKPTKSEKILASRILRDIGKVASAENLPVDLLCTRKEAIQLARHRKINNVRLMSGWRKELVEERVRVLIET